MKQSREKEKLKKRRTCWRQLELKEAKKRLENEATKAYSEILNLKSDLQDKQDQLAEEKK